MGTYSTPSYTAKDVADYVKRAFGDEAGVQVVDSDVIRWINAAQEEIVSANDVLKGTAQTAMTAGTYDYPLQSLDIKSLHSVIINGAKIQYYSFEDAEQKIFSEDPQRVQTGKPWLWYEWGGTINLYPTPDANGTITLYFTKNPTKVVDLTSTLGLPDNYFNRIVEYVLAQAYELDENFSAHANKIQQFDNKLMGMLNDEGAAPISTYPVMTVRPEDE